jgi:hypothetical protein
MRGVSSPRSLRDRPCDHFRYPYSHGSYFFDVQSGSNGSCGQGASAYLCSAQTGYDGPTGIGTPAMDGSGNGAGYEGPEGGVASEVSDGAAAVGEDGGGADGGIDDGGETYDGGSGDGGGDDDDGSSDGGAAGDASSDRRPAARLARCPRKFGNDLDSLRPLLKRWEAIG